MNIRETEYRHHSNPIQNPLSWVFFQKFFVRPLVEDAKNVIKHYESGAKEIQIARETLRNLDHNINGSASAPMMGGKAVERGCDEHFLENRPLDLACDYAYQDFMNYEPRNWDDGSDKLKTELVADEVFQVTNVAIEGLKEIFSGRNEEIVAQTHFLDYVDGLDLKYYTIPDYINCVDLKTKWSKPSQRTKAGIEKGSLPSRLTSQFLLPNLYQFAGFKMMTGKSPIALYVNKDEYRIFNKHTCDEMKDDFLDDVIADIKKRLKAIEMQIKAAPNKFWLLGMNPANLNDYAWHQPPSVLEYYKLISDQVEYETQTKQTEFERVQNEFTIKP